MHDLVATGYLSVSEFESWASHSVSKRSLKRYTSSLSLSTNIIRLLSVEGELIHIRNLEYCLVLDKHSANVIHHHYHHEPVTEIIQYELDIYNFHVRFKETENAH